MINFAVHELLMSPSDSFDYLLYADLKYLKHAFGH